jgi:hypothetical protein
MTIKEFFDMLVLTPKLFTSALKVQIGNHYIDISNLHIEEDMVVLHLPTE